MSEHRILVTCPKAMPAILAEEIRALGLPVVAKAAAGVETAGTLDDCMRLNLRLRTGHRVLRLIGEVTANSPDELYTMAVHIPWEEYLDEDGYVSVSAATETPGIKDSRYAALKCKDAIADRIKNARGRRPNSGPDQGRAVVFLHWKDGKASIYFDTSGEPLPRRGYRLHPWRAPMQETLAAAVVLTTGWTGQGSFINPMCGSGTLAIEAALIATGRAPGLLRKNFGFMHTKDFDAARWAALRAEAEATPDRPLAQKIIATDIEPEAVDAARQNAALARVDHLIEFGVCDFVDTPVAEGGGVVVFNPEYGERMGNERYLGSVYWTVGEFLKKKCKGYKGYVFTGNERLLKKIALKPSHTRRFFNSNIECALVEFELY